MIKKTHIIILTLINNPHILNTLEKAGVSNEVIDFLKELMVLYGVNCKKAIRMVIDDKSWESIDTSILIKGNHILIRFNILKIDGKTVEFTSTLPDSLAIIDLILKRIINIANMLGRDSIKDLPLDLLENIEENLAKIIDRVKLAKEEDKDENTAVKGVNKEL